MTLTIALRIMGMTAKALTKKFGSKAVGISKRIKAGDVISKVKKGKLASKRSAKINIKGGKKNTYPTDKDMMKEADRFNPFKKNTPRTMGEQSRAIARKAGRR